MNVIRWSRTASVVSVTGAVLAVALFGVPYVSARAQPPLITLFTLVALASLWNLMAGYAGLTSFGQQAYLGVGAYSLYLFAARGIDPFVGIALAALAAGIVSLPVSLLVLRLSGGYFAVATWVVAEVFGLLATISPEVGGNTGVTLPGIAEYRPAVRQAFTYWWALGLAVACVVGVYLLVRSRFGLDARAVHADPIAAASAGVGVERVRRTAYVLAALGTGAVGAVIFTHSLYIQPSAIFGVQYSVWMMFMVVIGGLGTVEGPIVGALLFFALQQLLSGYGPWYLVLLGVLAVLVTLFAPRGLWGTAAVRLGVSALPVGYRVSVVASTEGVSDASHPGGRAGRDHPAARDRLRL